MVVEVDVLLIGAVGAGVVLVLLRPTRVGTLLSVPSLVPPVRTTNAIVATDMATTPAASANIELRCVHQGPAGASYSNSKSIGR